MDDIEDRIIGDVEANTGDDFSADTSSNADNSDNGSNSSAEPTDSRRQEVQDGSQRRDDRNTRGKRDETGKGKQPDKGKQPEPKRDAKGNIVDDKGNVIASRGVERRLHHQNERLKEYTGTLTKQVSQLQEQLRTQQTLNGLPQQYGLTGNDVPEALKIAGAMKRDPVMGARMALEYALSQGAELTSIIQAEGLQNISLGAQRRMMEEMHQRTNGPMERERQQRAAQEHSQAQAQKFMVTYPDSAEHWDDIGRMIPEIISRAGKEGRNIDAYTAGEMALRILQNFAMQNGLDPNRSIQSQIDERAQNPQQGMNGQHRQPLQQRQDVRSPQPRQQAPMPNGSRGTNQVPSRSGSLPAGTSSDAIVRQAMMDNGYRFGN